MEGNDPSLDAGREDGGSQSGKEMEGDDPPSDAGSEAGSPDHAGEAGIDAGEPSSDRQAGIDAAPSAVDASGGSDSAAADAGTVTCAANPCQNGGSCSNAPSGSLTRVGKTGQQQAILFGVTETKLLDLPAAA